MAWEDVPALLVNYKAEQYAPDNAEEQLFNFYGISSLDNLPVAQREAFEKDLRYRYNACVNLRNSKLVRQQK
jgi:hypothetical protein